MVGRQRAQQLGHSCRRPTVAAAPEEGYVGGVVEEAVRLLQAVEVGRHFTSGAVEVDLVAGCSEGLHLQQRDHVHVIDPEARLLTEPGGDRLLDDLLFLWRQ